MDSNFNDPNSNSGNSNMSNSNISNSNMSNGNIGNGGISNGYMGNSYMGNNNMNNGYIGNNKVKDNGSFVKGLVTGVTATLVGLVIILVANMLINKDYIETDDRDQMMQNSGLHGSSSSYEELADIFEKAQTIQDIIDYYYYYDKDMDKLADGIYSGMMDSLGDPYSVYYDKEAYDIMMESTSGTYCGIGVVVQQDIETMNITVVTPYEECPGYEAGIRPGDIIIGADDVDFTGMDINEAVSYIRGEENTMVTVHILRDGEKMSLEVERRNIDVHTVEYECLEGNIAHIYITSFDEVTYDQFKEAMEQAEKDGCKGYIFDVRDNGGGLYDTVVNMLDDILPEGIIVYTEDKEGNKLTDYSDEECLEAPMVVLVNGNSASASEIFAGAIQDYGVGEIIGTKSFGKGIVQSVIPLRDGTAVKLTISAYFTPNGRNIHGEGITPDQIVELPQVEDAYENGYLKAEYDTQLQKAIEYLKGQMQ